MTKAESHYYLQRASGFTNRTIFTVKTWMFVLAAVVFVMLFSVGYLMVLVDVYGYTVLVF